MDDLKPKPSTFWTTKVTHPDREAGVICFFVAKAQRLNADCACGPHAPPCACLDAAWTPPLSGALLALH